MLKISISSVYKSSSKIKLEFLSLDLKEKWFKVRKKSMWKSSFKDSISIIAEKRRYRALKHHYRA